MSARRSPLQPRPCAFCGRDFVPSRRGAKYCSQECNKKAWTADRGRRRARARGRRERLILCMCCGKPVPWSPLVSTRRYCSAACKRRHENDVRRLSGMRADVVRVKPAERLPPSLDALRGTRSDEYFKALFDLPKEEQWAEMCAWTEEDHAAAAAYLGAGPGGWSGGPAEQAWRDDDIVLEMETPRGAFDEENHCGN